MKPQVLAKELANSIRESQEYKAWEAAKKKVDEHEAAKIMLEDFRKRQWELESARISGENVEEKEEEFKKLAEIINYNPYVREFLMAELNLNKMFMEIQKIIASAIGCDLPAQEEAKEQDN
ncbi:MAG: YlbF family regulator [Firmicutes bacterium]|nr:YlbF family regulator [Bacillota bacterium]